MADLEDFMTSAEYAQQIEQAMAEMADDLMVAAHIEPRRQERWIGGGSYGIGMMVRLKEKPRIDFKLEIFPNEIEEPHFKVVYKNTSCRFKIIDCTPMKAEAERGIPRPISKIMKEIKAAWSNNYDDLVKVWNKTRPSDRVLMHQKIR